MTKTVESFKNSKYEKFKKVTFVVQNKNANIGDVTNFKKRSKNFKKVLKVQRKENQRVKKNQKLIKLQKLHKLKKFKKFKELKTCFSKSKFKSFEQYRSPNMFFKGE